MARPSFATVLLVALLVVSTNPKPVRSLALSYLTIIDIILDLFLSCDPFSADVDCPPITLPEETDMPDGLVEKFDEQLPKVVDLIMKSGIIDTELARCRQALYEWVCTLGHGYAASRCKSVDDIRTLLPCEKDCRRFMESGCLDLGFDKSPLRAALDALDFEWAGVIFEWFLGDFMDTPEALVCNFLNEDTAACHDMQLQTYLPTLAEIEAEKNKASPGVIAAIVVSVLTGMVLIGGAAFLGYRQQKAGADDPMMRSSAPKHGKSRSSKITASGKRLPPGPSSGNVPLSRGKSTGSRRSTGGSRGSRTGSRTASRGGSRGSRTGSRNASRGSRGNSRSVAGRSASRGSRGSAVRSSQGSRNARRASSKGSRGPTASTASKGSRHGTRNSNRSSGKA